MSPETMRTDLPSIPEGEGLIRTWAEFQLWYTCGVCGVFVVHLVCISGIYVWYV